MGANERPERKTEEMIDRIQECRLVDINLLDDLYSNIATCLREKEKVDIVMMSPRIQQCIMYSHTSPSNEWTSPSNGWMISDHRATNFDIDYKKLEMGVLVSWQRTFPSN